MSRHVGARISNPKRSAHPKQELHSSVNKGPVPFDGDYEGIRPGRWYSHSLAWGRPIMHLAGIIPRTVLDHKGEEIRRLVVKGPDGDCIVSHVDPESME